MQRQKNGPSGPSARARVHYFRRPLVDWLRMQVPKTLGHSFGRLGVGATAVETVTVATWMPVRLRLSKVPSVSARIPALPMLREMSSEAGYLIDQFLWDQTNLREDEYGGDIGRRTRRPSQHRVAPWQRWRATSTQVLSWVGLGTAGSMQVVVQLHTDGSRLVDGPACEVWDVAGEKRIVDGFDRKLVG